MNRLELAQQLRRDCGISGSETTTINASGEWGDVVNWIDRAWNDIQIAHDDWMWMRKSFSFSTIAQQAIYAPAGAPLSLSDFGSWMPGTFRIYRDSIQSEIPLNFWHSYDQFRDTYLIGSLRSSYGQPTEVCAGPDKSLILALPPDSTNYTILGDYIKSPTILTLDASIPDMPARFHMLIVYEAMKYAGYKEGANELLMMHSSEKNRLLTLLEIDQLPKMVINRLW